MRRHAALVLSALLASALFACSDDSDSGGSGGSGGSAGSAGSGGSAGAGATGGSAGGSGSGGSAGSGGSSGSAGASGSGGSAGAAGLSCDAYCTTLMTNCANENAQYPSMETCMTVCATFPEGTASDTAGNTLGCRIYHAGAAGSGVPADATLHCPHAGPAGASLCGSNCEGYCNIMVPTCPGEFSGGMSECLNACDGFNGKDASEYTIASTTGDSLQCRIYHVTVASENQQAALTHCPHAGVNPTDFCL